MTALRKKEIFIIIITGIILVQANAQQDTPQHYQRVDMEPLHFGYTLGLNTIDLRMDLSDAYNNKEIKGDIALLRPGFHVGVVSDFRLGRYFSLRVLPEMTFGDMAINFETPDSIEINEDNNPLEVDYSPLQIPVLIKYKAKRMNNFRPYLVSGFSFSYDFDEFKSIFKGDKDEKYLSFRRLNYSFEAGFGIDFYFEFFKLSTELKYCIGMKDILNPDGPEEGSYKHAEAITEAFSSIRANMFMFSLHFE